MGKTSFSQLIPGNPGTSFVVCLLYTLQGKYGLETSNEDQLKLFMDGIAVSPVIFHCGILSTIATRYNKSIYAYTNNEEVLSLSLREVDSKRVTYEQKNLGFNDIKRLLNEFTFVTLSADIFSS